MRKIAEGVYRIPARAANTYLVEASKDLVREREEDSQGYRQARKETLRLETCIADAPALGPYWERASVEEADWSEVGVSPVREALCGWDSGDIGSERLESLWKNGEKADDARILVAEAVSDYQVPDNTRGSRCRRRVGLRWSGFGRICGLDAGTH